MEWAEAWNHHNLRENDDRERSPRDRFVFGQLQNSYRDMAVQRNEDDETIALEDLPWYGVDWEDMDSRQIMEHHNLHNEREIEDMFGSSLLSHRPPHLSLVEVPEFDCPLTIEEANIFNENLVLLPQYYSRNMDERKSVWIYARELLRVIASI